MVWYCSEVKLSHWDSEIRSLAAKALGRLAELDADLAQANLRKVISRCTASQPTVRHGSLLAVAEVVLSLSLRQDGSASVLSDEVIEEIVQIVPSLDKARLYRWEDTTCSGVLALRSNDFIA